MTRPGSIRPRVNRLDLKRCAVRACQLRGRDHRTPLPHGGSECSGPVTPGARAPANQSRPAQRRRGWDSNPRRTKMGRNGFRDRDRSDFIPANRLRRISVRPSVRQIFGKLSNPVPDHLRAVDLRGGARAPPPRNSGALRALQSAQGLVRREGAPRQVRADRSGRPEPPIAPRGAHRFGRGRGGFRTSAHRMYDRP